VLHDFDPVAVTDIEVCMDDITVEEVRSAIKKLKTTKPLALTMSGEYLKSAVKLWLDRHDIFNKSGGKKRFPKTGKTE